MTELTHQSLVWRIILTQKCKRAFKDGYLTWSRKRI